MGKKTTRQRGGAIIGVLFVILITSILLLGTGMYAVSHQNRTYTDLRYAKAIDLAEAGVNYELRRISTNVDYADQYPGTTLSYGGGTFKVYCANRDGSTPWVAPNPLYIYSTGTYDGVSRTVRASVKGYTTPGKYAIYTMESISVWNGSAISIDGDVGSNGILDFSGHPSISGSVYFYGPSAGWYNGIDPGGYSVYTEPVALKWETVEEVANRMFPSGGLIWLASHNDNLSAVPPITTGKITNSVTLVGKPGGADYYVTEIYLTGSRTITFDNTLGPVRIWVGPKDGSGRCRFRGGTAAVNVSDNQDKMNYIYVATRDGIDIAGNERLDAVLYCYNKRSDGTPFGHVINSGNPTINGQILAYDADINGNLTVNYVPNPIKPLNYNYYGFENSWVEVNPRW